MIEKRTSKRFNGKIGIYTTDSAGLNFGCITDLSREGVYIETQKLFPPGSSFEFVLSNGTVSAPIQGKVIRSKDAFFEGGVSGLAIEFMPLTGVSKRIRDDLLLFLMNQQYQNMWEAPQPVIS